MQPWLRWAMLSDLNNHLWLEPGTTCKNAELSPHLETQISPLLPKAALLCWGPSYTAALARQVHRTHPWEGKVPVMRRCQALSWEPAAKHKAAAQRGNRCGVWGKMEGGRDPGGSLVLQPQTSPSMLHRRSSRE